MKKSISVILSAFLLLQTSVVALADDWDNLVGSHDNVTGVYEEIVEKDAEVTQESAVESAAYLKLSAFGFAPQNTASTSYLTRSEFVTMVMKAAGISETSEVGEKIFADVPAEHSTAKYVYAAYRMGVISGSNGIFEPDGNVTMLDALVMTVRALGRDAEAKAKGGYPAGYLQVAASCDLTDGVSTSDYKKAASQNDLYKVMENALDCKRFAANSGFKNGEALYDTKSNETMLGYYHGIYIHEGVVNSVGSSSILSADKQIKNTVTVGNTKFDGNYEDYIDMLGMYVSAYWRENGSKAELLFVEQSDADNKVLILADKDITDFENNKYTYYDGRNEKRATLSKDASVVYNGRIIARNSKEYFIPDCGSVKLIDNNGDSSYDVAIVTDMVDMIVAAVSNDDCMIYDKYDSDLASSFDSSDPESVKILVNTNGKITYPAMVKTGNILSVAKSEDGVVTKGIVSIVSVKAKITDIYQENDFYVVADGTTYRVTPDCLSRREKLLVPGNTLTFKLNAMGDIAEIATGEGDDGYTYAYVIHHDKSSNSLSAKYGVKLLTQDGTIKVYDLRDNCKIDGTAYKSDSDKNSALARGIAIGPVVRFVLDGDGLVSEIDTSYLGNSEDAKNTLQKIYSSDMEKMHHKTTVTGGAFGEKIVWGFDNTITFVTYSNETSENKKYRVSVRGQFDNDGSYAPEAYRSSDSFYADVLVKEISSSGSATAGSKTLRVVEDIRVKPSDEGSSMISLKLNTGSSKEDVTIESDVFYARDIEIGDMVRCDTSDGAVIGESIVKTYDIDDNKLLEKNNESASNDLQFIRLGYVYDVKDNLIQYSVLKGDTDNLKVVQSISNMYTVEKDRNGKVSVTKASMSDLLTYLACGDECTELIVHYQYQLPLQMFIIK